MRHNKIETEAFSYVACHENNYTELVSLRLYTLINWVSRMTTGVGIKRKKHFYFGNGRNKQKKNTHTLPKCFVELDFGFGNIVVGFGSFQNKSNMFHIGLRFHQWNKSCGSLTRMKQLKIFKISINSNLNVISWIKIRGKRKKAIQRCRARFNFMSYRPDLFLQSLDWLWLLQIYLLIFIRRKLTS